MNAPRTASIAPPPHPDHASLRAAAQWFATLDHGSQPDRATHARLQHWLAQDPRHRAAWAQVQAVSANFDRLPGALAHAALRAPARSRRRAIGAFAVLGAVGTTSWWAGRSAAWPDAHTERALARTARGEVRELALATGARAWLNADTDIAIDNSPQARRIRLVAGEIFIASGGQTGPSQRPLFVDTVHGSVQALGTRFSVRADARAAVQVSVFEDAVRITPSRAAHAAKTLRQGEQAWFTADQVTAVSQASVARQAWIDGMLVADNLRLDALLAELSHHRRGYLGCDPAVATLRLDGVFPLRDTDAALAMLAQSLPVAVRRITPWWVTVGPLH